MLRTGKVSDKKKYLVHVAISSKPLYSTCINSRTELTQFLRQSGVRFRDSELSGIGSGSVMFEAKTGIRYEVEEQICPSRSIIFDNKVYIPLSDYCRLTGESRRAVRYSYHKRRIRGMTVGKKNLIYIYKEDAV